MRVTVGVIFLSAFNNVLCFNILAVLPIPHKSHFFIFKPLLMELSKRGHNLTVLTHFKLKNPMNNHREILIKDDLNASKTDVSVTPKKYGPTLYLEILNFIEFGEINCRKVLEQKNVQNFIKESNKFDIVITEFFNGDCFLGFADKFKTPIVGLSTTSIISWHSQFFGNPDNPAYIPNHPFDFSDHMTFFERVENFLVNTMQKVHYNVNAMPKQSEILKQYFGDGSRKLSEIMLNSSLLLVNTHFSLNLPRPLVPNVVEIGGLHIGELKPLPKNIEKWIEESSDGVIYFSLGSMIKGHTFPADKRKEFQKAFGRLSQTVLWKWENETMEGKPNNVMIQKWMPQFDILCNPNVKAFISHGGLLGVTEAVHCGVAVIVMPQFGDQFTNAKALESVGGGVILHLSEATEESITKALKTVLTPKFRQQAKELSERFRDRPMSPMDTAIYWVEYVARHKGAPHMRTAAVNMPFYQYYLLDVISFLILVVVLTLYIVFIILRTFLRMLFGSKSKKVKTN